MKKLTTLLLLLIGVYVSFAQNDLFRIVVNDKIGYIDNTGKIIIQTKYNNGTDFFGEYAAVRENGLYGIINTKGEYVLKPSYEMILRGVENYTVGKNNGRDELIDLTGKIKFKKQVKYCNLTPEYLFVYTPELTTYVFDRKTGKKILYSPYILTLPYENVCVANNERLNGFSEHYVTSLDGDIIVNKNTYSKIASFQEGVAKVQIDDSTYGVIDTNGKLLFTTNHNLFARDKKGNDMGGYHEGYVLAKLTNPSGKDCKDLDNCYGYLDKSGNVVYTDSFFTVQPFKNGITVIVQESGERKILDSNFRKVDLKDYWHSGIDYQVEKKHAYWAITDNSGRELLQLDKDCEGAYEALQDGIFFYYKKLDNEFKTGFINLNKSIKFPAIIDKYTTGDFSNGLLQAQVNKKLTYINESGKIVWQKPDDDGLIPLNSDFKLNLEFIAHDTIIKKFYDNTDLLNLPIKNQNDIFKPNQISVVIDVNKSCIYNKIYKGISVYVANTTANPFELIGSGQNLLIVLEAKDKKKRWKNISHVIAGVCGPNFTKLILPNDEHLEFCIPEFEGSFETELRVRIYPKYNKEKSFYSNTIRAKINPSQFFYTKPEVQQDLLDPYSN